MLYTFMGAAMTMICSKIRLQIKNRTKLKWFGPIFYFVQCQDEGGSLLCPKFRLQLKKIGPNCNGLVLYLFLVEIKSIAGITFIMAAPSRYITRHCRSLPFSASMLTPVICNSSVLETNRKSREINRKSRWTNRKSRGTNWKSRGTNRKSRGTNRKSRWPIGRTDKPTARAANPTGRDLTTRFNKIAIQATAQMAADKEAVGLSRVNMPTNLSVSCPYEVIIYSVPKHINTARMHTISRQETRNQPE